MPGAGAGLGGAGRLRVGRQQREPGLGGLPHDRQRLALALELRLRVRVDVGGRAHLVRVPQRPGDVDALQPWHAVEVLGNQHDHVLRTALALWAGAAEIGDARAAEQRSIEWPPVRDPPNVSLELAVVELLVGHPTPIVAQEAACGKARTRGPNTRAAGLRELVELVRTDAGDRELA